MNNLHPILVAHPMDSLSVHDHVIEEPGKLLHRPRHLSRTRKGEPRLRGRRNGSGFATPLGEPAMTGGTGSWRAGISGLVVAVSARKLAAGLWHLEAEVNSSVGCGGGMTWHCQRGRFGQLQIKHQSLLPITEPAMEGATKWDIGHQKRPSNLNQFHNIARPLKSRQVAPVSVTSDLKVELIRARNIVQELEIEQELFKKKLKQLLRKLYEENALWMKRKEQKMHAIIGDLKDELKRERRNSQKMAMVNSKLLSDLADAKLSIKQFMHDYLSERKDNKLLEDACTELLKEIEDNKAKIKAMEIECSKIQEEVLEERKMHQMAEVWREERVQMKLVDAKLILEEKYCQMNNLVADLETFLRSRDAIQDMTKTTEGKGIGLVMDAMNMQDIKDPCHMPPKSCDICTIVEDNQRIGTKEKENYGWLSHSLANHSSKMQNDNPKDIESTQKFIYEHFNNYIENDRSSGNASVRETVTHAGEQHSSYSFGSSACFGNGTGGDRHMSSAIAGPNQNADQESLNFSTNKICSVEKLKMKGSSFRKIWRSLPSTDDVCKTISVDGNGRFSNASNSSKLAISPEKVSGEGAFNYHELVGSWCSPSQRNPHIARGMKGCIEWPRGIQSNDLNTKILEASLESQKTQEVVRGIHDVGSLSLAFETINRNKQGMAYAILACKKRCFLQEKLERQIKGDILLKSFYDCKLLNNRSDGHAPTVDQN